MIATPDLYWLAGLFEGEACFSENPIASFVKAQERRKCLIK